MRALKGGAFKLGQRQDLYSFAIIKKHDVSVGMFELNVDQKSN
jgi:hypothetical protein